MTNFFLTLVGIIFLFGVVAAYFVPYIVASKRHHSQRRSIGLLNLLFGWTCIGWLFALVWALDDDVEYRLNRLEKG
jgi:hypothetical protein